MLATPQSAPGTCAEAVLVFQWPVWAGLSWLARAGYLIALPLSVCRTGRFIAWSWMLAMHLAVLLIVNFADLTFGMLMIQIFTFDPDWLQPRSARSPIGARQNSSPPGESGRRLYEPNRLFWPRTMRLFS